MLRVLPLNIQSTEKKMIVHPIMEFNNTSSIEYKIP